MRLRLVPFLLFVLVCAATPVCAFDAAQSYLDAQTLPPELLPPPPAEGSAAWKEQIAGVLRAQKNLPAAAIAAARDEQHVRLEMMTSVLGPDFTRERLPKTFALLDRVLAAAGQVSEADKKFWHTRRPYLADARVKLYVDPIDASPAYPSGHTTDTRVLAEVLGMLMPEKRDELRARAAAIAEHRVEAGVHYPVDVEGGRLLAMLVVGALANNDDFEEDLAVAKKEIAGR